MTRPYTGLKDYPAKGKRPGTEYFAASLNYLTGGKIWNNGTYGIRPIRGGVTPSVHGTGRAVDLSRRDMGTAGKRGMSRTAFVASVINPLIENADLFGIELVVDYGFGVGGRTWRCDRGTWINQPKGRIAGGGWGDWIHVELDPAHADNPKLTQDAWHQLLSGLTPASPPEAAVDAHLDDPADDA